MTTKEKMMRERGMYPHESKPEGEKMIAAMEGKLEEWDAIATRIHQETVKMEKILNEHNRLMEMKHEMAKRYLDDPLMSIVARVAAEFGVTVSEIMSRRRTEKFIVPRHVAMYLLRQVTDMSLAQIGEMIGHRDHGTVLHAIKAVESRMDCSPHHFKPLVERIRSTIETKAVKEDK